MIHLLQAGSIRQEQLGDTICQGIRGVFPCAPASLLVAIFPSALFVWGVRLRSIFTGYGDMPQCGGTGPDPIQLQARDETSPLVSTASMCLPACFFSPFFLPGECAHIHSCRIGGTLTSRSASQSVILLALPRFLALWHTQFLISGACQVESAEWVQ